MNFTPTDWLAGLRLVGAVGLFAWNLVEMTRFPPKDRLPTRSVTVRRESISPRLVQWLKHLPDTVEASGDFIRVGRDGALISAWPKGYGTAWPCVAWVDFAKDRGELQYRVPLPTFLFGLVFLPSISAILWYLVLAVMIAINHRVFRGAIRRFLRVQLSRSRRARLAATPLR